MGQHVVPQEYLRPFASDDERGLLWSYDKKSKQVRELPIAAVAQSSGFYPADVESKLNTDVECPANLVIKRILAASPENPVILSQIERERLADYSVVMIRRVPKHRHRIEALIPDVLEETERGLVARLDVLIERGGLQGIAASCTKAQVRESLARYRESGIPSDLLNEIQNPWTRPLLRGALLKMTWRIVHVDSGTWFVTSDNPACYFEGLGMGKPHSEFVLPLSSGVALWASYQPGPDCSSVRVRAQFVKEINRRLVNSASRFVFYHEDARWLRAQLSRTPLRENRLLLSVC